MRGHRNVAVGAGMLVASVLSCVVLAAESKSPTRAYLDYHDAVVKAATLSEVLPHLSAAYRGMLESRPKKDQPEWLARLKESANMKDIKFGKETINGEKCTLEATATSARGNAMKGKISLVKEKGAWRLDEEGWST